MFPRLNYPVIFTDPSGEWCIAGFSVGPGRTCNPDEVQRWAGFYANQAEIWHQIGSGSHKALGFVYGFAHEYLDAISIIGTSSIVHAAVDRVFGCGATYNLYNPDVVRGRYGGRAFVAGQAIAEIGSGVIGGIGGIAASGTGVGAIAGIPVATFSVALVGHGVLMAGHLTLKVEVDPLPNIFFSQSGGNDGNKSNDPTLNYGTNTGDTGLNSQKLRSNMEAKGIFGKNGEAAHHIVPSTNKYFRAREAREILHKFGIDINQAENGVFINKYVNSHINSRVYMDAVQQALSVVESQDDAIKVLGKIGKQLLAKGTYP